METISQSDIKRYQTLFKQQQGIDLSTNEITIIIENIDKIGSLLFDKYLQNE